MRIGSLLALAILAPTFVSAADSPSLAVYTISHDTIYPSAVAGSGLATTTAIDLAFSEAVKVSLKVVSASGATVKSLYTSSSVTNPTPKIWDGMNSAGVRVDDGIYTVLISATSTATSLLMTDSSKKITIASSGGGGSSDTSETPSDTTPTLVSTPSSGSGPAEYAPIPTLRLVTEISRTISSGADAVFSTVVYDAKSNKRDDAIVMWSFGDGMRRTGASVFHAYYGSGEYLAVVRASTADGGAVQSEIVVTVQDASIKIASVSSRGISVINNGPRTLDLSLWKLSMGGQEFKIPEDTHILAGHTILFPSQVIELPTADSARLLYPSGEVAAEYPLVLHTQPSLAPQSYERVQADVPPVVKKTEPITNTQTNLQTHDETVIAPTAAVKPAAVGAASAVSSKIGGLLHSPWTLGLLGVVLLAGGAFILL